jgi:RNA polymerase sigma factor (sigma-70 family)
VTNIRRTGDPFDAGPLRYDEVVLRLLRPPRPSGLQDRHDELAELARRAQRGERPAVRTLVTVIGPQILRVVRRVLGPSHPEVEDAAQEAAFAVLEALARYRGESTIVHFARRVAVQTALNYRRRELTAKRRSTGDQVDLDGVADACPGPDAEADGRADAELVRELVATLPQAQAEALAMHCVLGYTITEIAEASSLPVETVRSRLRLAKNSLRDRAQTTPRLARLVEAAE